MKARNKADQGTHRETSYQPCFLTLG